MDNEYTENNIYKKLLKISSKNIKVEKDAKNPFFKNDYTSLNEVLSKIKDELAKENLLIIQSPKETGLETKIVDVETQEEISSFIQYIKAEDMQKLGGAITYARRYALISMLGLESEDDDGNTASGKVATKIINKNEDIDY
jgi:hypothetical protein